VRHLWSDLNSPQVPRAYRPGSPHQLSRSNTAFIAAVFHASINLAMIAFDAWSLAGEHRSFKRPGKAQDCALDRLAAA
jgi:hypothetical protein